MKTNQSYESFTTSKEEIGVKSVAMHERDKLEQRFRGCYPVQCVQIGIYKRVGETACLSRHGNTIDNCWCSFFVREGSTIRKVKNKTKKLSFDADEFLIK